MPIETLFRKEQTRILQRETRQREKKTRRPGNMNKLTFWYRGSYHEWDGHMTQLLTKWPKDKLEACVRALAKSRKDAIRRFVTVANVDPRHMQEEAILRNSLLALANDPMEPVTNVIPQTVFRLLGTTKDGKCKYCRKKLEDDVVMLTNCGHCVHKTCLDSCIRSMDESICPVCFAAVITFTSVHPTPPAFHKLPLDQDADTESVLSNETLIKQECHGPSEKKQKLA